MATRIVAHCVALAVLAIIPVTAFAAGDPFRCPAGAVCVWKHDHFNGPMKVYAPIGCDGTVDDATYTDDHYNDPLFPNDHSSVNDSASSVCNRTHVGHGDSCVNFFWDSNYKFAYFTLSEDTCASDLNNDLWWNFTTLVFNDQLSSHQRWTTNGSPCPVAQGDLLLR